MRHTIGLLIAVMLLTLCPSGAHALVTDHADVNRERRVYREFRLRAETRIDVSARCETRGNAPQFRVMIQRRTPQGTWGRTETLVHTNSAQEGSTTITLPEGNYRVTITARRMEYWLTMLPSRD